MDWDWVQMGLGNGGIGKKCNLHVFRKDSIWTYKDTLEIRM